MGDVYEGSDLCVPDGSGALPDDYIQYIPSSRPGGRAPHAWLPDGRSTLDLFGNGLVLLRFEQNHSSIGSSPEEAASKLGVPLVVVQIDTPALAHLYAYSWVMVRLDGHVCWRGHRIEDPESLIKTISGH